MKFIILIALLSLFASSAIAQQASCSFATRFVGGVQVYSCGLTLNNPDGADITTVEGTHLAGFSDADVQGITRLGGLMNAPYPGVFCARFPNTRRVAISSAAITNITDESFGNCPDLEYLAILYNNISSVSANAFTNNPIMDFIDLDNNWLSTLPENVFANQAVLTSLDIRNNPFTDIPAGAFNGLSALERLFMQNIRVTAINPAWFAGTPNLLFLYLGNNQLTSLTVDSFSTLTNLQTLSLFRSNIGEFHADLFFGLTNLRSLDVGGNNIREINESTFVGLENLDSLYLSDNVITTIASGSFRVLSNLLYLSIGSASIREVESGAFEGLSHLASLNLNFNNIEDLPEGIFVPLVNMSYLGLWNNRIKVINRHYFGANVSALQTIDLDGNVVNALERSFLDDALNLNTLFFSNNLCASGVFSGFIANRVQFMERLERCFRNFELIVEAVTDNNDNYSFFSARNPGLVARVQAGGEIQIALTPFSFPWSPMIEVIIGAGENSRSIIRRNQSEDVAVVPTPGILRSDSSNLFRVVWANHVVLVFRENEEWPFLVYTLVDFFNVNFYGLRSPQSRATWSILPIEF